MAELASNLRSHFDAVLESRTDPQFYQALHGYFDFVYKNPKLKEILEADEDQFRSMHSALNDNQDLSYEEHAELVHRIERFSLFANAVAILVRVYEPLEDYKYSLEPEDKQDPVALLMMKGIKGISTKKWDKKTLNMYNRWYKGRRSKYEDDLRQVHLMFLDALSSAEPDKKPEPLKSKNFTFNEKTGQFVYLQTKGFFNPGTQPYKLMTKLFTAENNQASYLELWQVLYPEAEQVSKPQRSSLSFILRNIKEELRILPKSKTSNPNIIKNMPKHGYRLVIPE